MALIILTACKAKQTFSRFGENVVNFTAAKVYFQRTQEREKGGGGGDRFGRNRKQSNLRGIINTDDYRRLLIQVKGVPAVVFGIKTKKN